MVKVLVFGHGVSEGLPLQTVRVTDDVGNGLLDQLLHTLYSTLLEHSFGLFGVWTDVSIDLKYGNKSTKVSVGLISTPRVLMVAKSLPQTWRDPFVEKSKRFFIK